MKRTASASSVPRRRAGRRDVTIPRAHRAPRASLRPLSPLLKIMLNPIARASLRKRMSRVEIRHLLVRTWTLYPTHLGSVDRRLALGVGPALVLRLAACTSALHDALLEHGATHEGAIQIAAEVGWAVYRQMGRIPWLLSGLISRNPAKRLSISTQIFRRFPFGPSAYGWETKPSPAGVVAFNCVRCPVAEYFAAGKLSDLCVATFCALDFPLAHDWGAELQRNSSIAAGAPICDFRWHVKAQQPTPSQ